MEMYSGTWALVLLYVLVGPLLGLFLPLVTIPVAICGFFTRKPRRGVVLSRVALGFAITPILFTLVMWYELITGLLPNGERVDFHDEVFTMYQFVAIFDSIALSAAIASWVRQKLRRHAATEATASPPAA